ncbi:isoprenylcysteine carboxylmethyltransferase family protein [Undibacterium sp.]|uniref:methyltransferase family protein n=1 Tax=Undibacterium sp. TaxID=1914977 RepID=UPI002C757DC5|nr:isoprenylcysteine carboxylmethyltransferase family protein [Undibacterium sp.]HTD05969.1 isoprenylcysteine carboxylmethyltransferase family protein [Undibacterium sp.]
MQLIIGLGVALFASAWTLDFWQAWAYLFVFVVSSALITAYLWRKDPGLLARRVNAGPGAETDRQQKLIQVFASIVFIGAIVCPALEHRFSASAVPLPVVIAGDGLVALGFFIVFMVFKENSFAAATIVVAAEQEVVSTGPYAIVRHPMYAGALILFFGTPLALGSWRGLLLFIPMALVIGWRLLNEEKLLSKELSGYLEYCSKVPYRLVPGIW